jgi:hypothetical protein
MWIKKNRLNGQSNRRHDIVRLKAEISQIAVKSPSKTDVRTTCICKQVSDFSLNNTCGNEFSKQLILNVIKFDELS